MSKVIEMSKVRLDRAFKQLAESAGGGIGAIRQLHDILAAEVEAAGITVDQYHKMHAFVESLDDDQRMLFWEYLDSKKTPEREC